MGDTLSDSELINRLKMLAEHGGNRQRTAAAMGLGRAAFAHSIVQAKAKGFTSFSKVTNEADILRSKLKMMQLELAKTTADNITVAEIRTKIYGLAENVPEPPKWLVKPGKAKSSGIPMAFFSDWHYGEIVEYAEVGGTNVFNAKVAKARVKLLVEKIIELCFHHMVKPNYPGLVLCLGGDMISGEIHEELRETNEMGIQQARVQVEGLLIWAIKELAKRFGKVYVPCVVGNHGRTTRKPRAKHRVFDNHDYGIYLALEREFKNDKRVQFHIGAEPDALLTVAGHRFLLTHGDALGTAGGDGIIGALGPITRGAIKVGRQQAQIGRDFDTLLIGHWHQYIPRSDASSVICNGALKGYDEYANTILRAKYARPTQALWFVSKDHGITAQWPIYLEKDRRPQIKNAKWVSWQEYRSAA